MSNFAFLEKRWPVLADNARLAEKYITSDPNAALFKMRIFSEQLIDLTIIALKLNVDEKLSQHDKIQVLRDSKINNAVPDLFDKLILMSSWG